MTYQPSLFIIIPTLDSSDVLPSLVSSLQDQTYCNWTAIFIDGPSCSAHRAWLDALCASDSRFSWILQPISQPGIFGAMNHGFSLAREYDWVLFWGSDDLAFNKFSFSTITREIYNKNATTADLVFFAGSYFSPLTGLLTRYSSFNSSSFFSSWSYRVSLFCGASPVHQATLFGKGARKYLSSYNLKYILSADLDYFLRFSRFPAISIYSSSTLIVNMSSGGISGKFLKRRLIEVSSCYIDLFGPLFFVPFVLRYLKRLIAKI